MFKTAAAWEVKEVWSPPQKNHFFHFITQLHINGIKTAILPTRLDGFLFSEEQITPPSVAFYKPSTLFDLEVITNWTNGSAKHSSPPMQYAGGL